MFTFNIDAEEFVPPPKTSSNTMNDNRVDQTPIPSQNHSSIEGNVKKQDDNNPSNGMNQLRNNGKPKKTKEQRGPRKRNRNKTMAATEYSDKDDGSILDEIEQLSLSGISERSRLSISSQSSDMNGRFQSNKASDLFTSTDTSGKGTLIGSGGTFQKTQQQRNKRDATKTNGVADEILHFNTYSENDNSYAWADLFNGNGEPVNSTSSYKTYRINQVASLSGGDSSDSAIPSHRDGQTWWMSNGAGIDSNLESVRSAINDGDHSNNGTIGVDEGGLQIGDASSHDQWMQLQHEWSISKNRISEENEFIAEALERKKWSAWATHAAEIERQRRVEALREIEQEQELERSIRRKWANEMIERERNERISNQFLATLSSTQWFNEMISSYHEDYEMVCPYFKMGCRTRCYRTNLKRHLEECTFAYEIPQPVEDPTLEQYEVVCPNTVLGCQFTGDRSALKAHLELCPFQGMSSQQESQERMRARELAITSAEEERSRRLLDDKKEESLIESSVDYFDSSESLSASTTQRSSKRETALHGLLKTQIQQFACEVHDEIKDLWEQHKSSTAKQQLRDRLVVEFMQQLQTCVHQIWPYSRIEVFGSYATGLSSTENGDLDLVICFSDEYQELLTMRGTIPLLHALADHLQRRADSFLSITNVLLHARIPVVKGEVIVSNVLLPDIDMDPQLLHWAMTTRLSVDISLDGPSHSGLATTELVRTLLSALPPLGPVFHALKEFLKTNGLCDAYTGGLPSYGLILLLTLPVMKHARLQGYFSSKSIKRTTSTESLPRVAVHSRSNSTDQDTKSMQLLHPINMTLSNMSDDIENLKAMDELSIPASPSNGTPSVTVVAESGDSTYPPPSLTPIDNNDGFDTSSFKSKERSASESSSHRRQDGLPPLPPASSTPPSEVGIESRKSISNGSQSQPKHFKGKHRNRDVRPKSLGTSKSRGISEIDFFLRNHVTYSTSSPLYSDSDIDVHSSLPRIATFTSLDMQRDFGRKVACKLLGDQAGSADTPTSRVSILRARPLLTDERPIFGLILEEFLKNYGEEMKLGKHGYSVRDGGFRFHVHGDEGKPSHPQAADPLLIEDPVDVFNNVARNCFRSTVVHRAFFDAYEKLKAAAVRHHQHSHHRQSSRSHARSPNIDSPVQAQRKISRSKNEELSNTLPTVRQSLRNFTVRSKSPVPVDAFYRQDRLPHPSPLTRDMTVDATEALPKLNLSSKNQPSRSTFKKLDEGDSDDGSEVLVSSAPHTISQQPIISEESRRRISEARALFESRTPRDSPLATPRESGLEKAGQDDPHRFESPKEVKNNPSDLLFNNKTLLFEILGIDVAKSQINT